MRRPANKVSPLAAQATVSAFTERRSLSAICIFHATPHIDDAPCGDRWRRIERPITLPRVTGTAFPIRRPSVLVGIGWPGGSKQ